ncbi:Peptidyl-tRNA hydrolase ICT1, mitochondrial [Babesia bigemina]|uniref:Peptidyl-tRNA hydrolase ICT1, mitochondrial n=1 Tax=Babesia bigemina TaxID=5866 RepID=A0A061D6M1_BABBI|nr:Peptidyl-tRNA hydrolase ICT1, mitochondrial [Babesia bigemina]CDR96321.1 Peptidyl-tRNA hydrolase ICT1, mitochondrial [Babesia bigemina]|eukprot:XP_012768507.1 Peptidyl-tRNA hydrolase ICT1, mitochondrial [Babesia bigemina]
MLRAINDVLRISQRRIATGVPINKIKLTSSRSSGPGGQSVNKSETKVQARFNVEHDWWLPPEVRDKFRTPKIRQLHKNKITRTGDFVVESDEHSSQEQNRKACIEKIKAAIRQAEQYEPEEKLSFLEQIERDKTPKEIREYKQKRRESKRKLKQIGHKTMHDF